MDAPQATYRRLGRYLRPYRGRLALAVAASVGGAAAASFYAYLIGPLLSALLGGRSAQVGPVFLGGERLVTTVPLLVVGVAVLKASAQWAYGGMANAVGQAVMTDLRRDLHS